MKFKFIILMKFIYLLNNKTALHLAVENGDTEIVQSILSKSSVDINFKQVFVLFNL